MTASARACPLLPALLLLPALVWIACGDAAGTGVAAARPLCGEGTRFVSWAEMGLPADAMPLDLALDRDSVWVVFDPPLLARLPRRAGAETGEGAGVRAEVLVVAPEEGEVWTAVDVDPVDGALWLARGDGDELLRVDPATGALRRLSLAGFGGGGGLVDVRAGRQGLAVSPYCSEHGLWTVARSGEPLGTAFPAGESDPHADLRDPRFGCPRVFLDRLPESEVVAFALSDRRLHRWRGAAGGAGAWAAGEPVALDEEAAGSVSALFHHDGTPVLLGAAATGPGDRPLGTWIHRLDPGSSRGGGAARAMLERCDSRVLVAAEGDGAGLAALTPGGLLLVPAADSAAVAAAETPGSGSTPLAPPDAGR
ncbi:MAG TPA: hypothetical protein VHQ65_02705 [Thermoanaerobaculia bacterium]|nr:hypothetical protein [Thermoanaerobaculia bacterium]